jgi:hypothetical protein
MKRRSWNNSLIGLAFFVFCVLGCGSASKTVNKEGPGQPNNTVSGEIAGRYAVTGTNEDGSPYQGELEVIAHGAVYQFRWNAGKQYDGIGIENGKVIAVAFTEGTDGKGCGVVSYKVLSNGVLDGRWGYWGTNESGTERASPLRSTGLPGNYDLSGKNPDGSLYKGRLLITEEGGGYKFAWDNNSSGFGVRQAETLTVGIGGSQCAFVAYEIKSGGTLEGVWGGYGSTRTGMEKAVRN